MYTKNVVSQKRIYVCFAKFCGTEEGWVKIGFKWPFSIIFSYFYRLMYFCETHGTHLQNEHLAIFAIHGFLVCYSV